MKNFLLNALAITEIAVRGLWLVALASLTVGLFCWVLFNDQVVR
jgi:hypothetical protein